MSTRYVYEVYSTGVSNKTLSLLTVNSTAYYDKMKAYVCSAYKESVAKNREGASVVFYEPEIYESEAGNVYFDTLLSTGSSSSTHFEVKNALTYKYAIVTCMAGYQDGTPIVSESYLVSLLNNSGKYWHSRQWPTEDRFDLWTNDYGQTQAPENATKLPFMATGGEIKPNTLQYRESRSQKNLEEGAFQASGTWRWRVYKGADSIDPTAVTYSKTDLYPGDSVVISVTPATPTYGGTISYQYQYSLDGGNTWTNIGNKTTETTAAITIPEGAKQFQARVTASDGWGFTSTTRVSGPSLGVSQLKAYAAVSGFNRTGVKMYAAVGGKIREIQKGYAAVGGKIRKMF